MDLKDIIRICFSQGKTYYTHTQLEAFIRERYNFNYGLHVNSKMIRRAGIKGIARKMNGKTVNGFWLDIKDLTMDQIRQVYESTIKPKQDTSHPVFLKSPETVEKKIRFLMRDWDQLPQWCKMDYKRDKDEYLKEIQRGSSHKTEWFYKILKDLHNSGFFLNYEGKDIDFVLMPANDIVRHLHESGATKRAKRPDPDKVHYVLTNHGYVRINDFVYGKLYFSSPAAGLPDWEV